MPPASSSSSKRVFVQQSRKRKRAVGCLLVACWTLLAVKVIYNEFSNFQRPQNDGVVVVQSNHTTALRITRSQARSLMNEHATIRTSQSELRDDDEGNTTPDEHHRRTIAASASQTNPTMAFATVSSQSQHDENDPNIPSLNADTRWRRLRNINIVMMGDSLMRYQYLSLVYYLRWGQWFDPNITLTDNLMVESTWEGHTARSLEDTTLLHRRNLTGSWNTFMYYSNRLLYPYEVCDCYRERKAVNAYVNMMENRYFYDPIYNNTVLYIQAMGHHTNIHGRIPDPTTILGAKRNVTLWNEVQQRLVGTWSPYEWEYTEWHDVIQHYLAPLRADYIVLNSGWWGSKFSLELDGDNNHTATILLKQAMDDVFHNSLTRGIWRTTTYPAWPQKKRWGSNALAVDHILCQPTPLLLTRLRCLNVSWTRHVPRKLSKDGIHFLEPVYRIMNEAMLELMGYPVTSFPNNDKPTLGSEHDCLNKLLSRP